MNNTNRKKNVQQNKLLRFLKRLFKAFATAMLRFSDSVRRKPKVRKRNMMVVCVGLLVLGIIISAVTRPSTGIITELRDTEVVESTTEPIDESSHRITGIPIVVQDYYKAGCETYACIMLLQGLGYDIDEHEFIDNYLIRKDMYYSEDGSYLLGPDMDAAYAGDIFTGCGINSPAMAKSMNNYLTTQPKGQRANAANGYTLEQLCEKYVKNDIPVMTWVTTYMEESYEKMTWVVNYVDENSTHQIGDTVAWRQNEHCMVLIGYDKDNYIFCDSVAGKVVSHDKSLAETRFKEIGSQAIVVQ